MRRMNAICCLGVLAALFCASCSTPDCSNRIDISIINTESTPIRIKASLGSLSKTIRIEPHATWEGWILSTPAPKQIRLVIQVLD